MGSLEPRLVEAAGLQADEEGLELQEALYLVVAEGCDVEVAEHPRHAAYVDDTGEIGVRSEGTAGLLSCRGTRYHLLITGLGDGR